MDGDLNFMSVSSDGRVVTWIIVKVQIIIISFLLSFSLFRFFSPLFLSQNELQYEDTMILKIPEATVPGAEGTKDQAIGIKLIPAKGLHG